MVDAATLEFLDGLAIARALEIKNNKSELDVSDYIAYLRLDTNIEPELIWIAREMCCAPLPVNVEKLVSKSNLVYFHDKKLDVYTIEHPLTQRFLKVLEWQRLELLTTRKVPVMNELQKCLPETDYLLTHPHLQVPCMDCGSSESSFLCLQCVSTYCDICFGLLHARGSRRGHSSTATPVGSRCPNCTNRQPHVFCKDCGDFFCFGCFEELHRRGNRAEHNAMRVCGIDGNILQSRNTICDECKDVVACLRCDFCKDAFCLVCFWRCHLGGNRRQHTASLSTIRPLCNECNLTRASIYCMQCQQLYCSACFGNCHSKGQRKLHLFIDAMNILLLLEKLEPGYQKFMASERQKVLRSILRIEAHVRGYHERLHFRKCRELATVIQKRWRGIQTRRNLIGVLDQFNWRKRQITNRLLGYTATEEFKREIRSEAVQSRMEVASKHQSRLMSLLRRKKDNSDAVASKDSLGLHPTKLANASDPDPGIPHTDLTSALKARITKNSKEKDKLKKLLNLYDDYAP